jgi:hypothetical protein
MCWITLEGLIRGQHKSQGEGLVPPCTRGSVSLYEMLMGVSNLTLGGGHRARRAAAPRRPSPGGVGKGLQSSTSQLNVHSVCGMRYVVSVACNQLISMGHNSSHT